MNKIKSLILILVFLFSNELIAFSKDFRDSSWGMSKSQVNKLEKFELVLEETNTLSYKRTLFDCEIRVIYSFEKNKLVRSGYLFDPYHTLTENSLHNSFNDFKTKLIKNMDILV